MPVYYLHFYASSDFVNAPPIESGAATAGSQTFTLELKPGAMPNLITVNDNDLIFDELDATQSLNDDVTIDGTP